MVRFDCDYMEGAHPEIIQKLVQTNLEQTPGYGFDSYTKNAERLILEACGLKNGRVFFLVGGTQTNATVIDALLSHCEGVLATEAAHINVHECGAIEASGHKVITLPEHSGKLCADEIEDYASRFYADETYPHMVFPGMVYISHPTEYGTLYSLSELERISEVCRSRNIPLYLDGARLAYGLASAASDVSLQDIARLCDAFYIGGTKCGALFGEAVVIANPARMPRFFSIVKQHGALLAKGRLLGLQFETLFTDNLYSRIGSHGIEMAMRLKFVFKQHGYKLFFDSPTNQQFFVLPNHVIERLKENVSFELWGAPGHEETPVRFVTDWATNPESIDNLDKYLSEI
mgnify:FL=1